MKHEIYVWLKDIRKSIDEIYEFLPEDVSYSEFEKDLKTRKAVERNIGIIGEALNRILKADLLAVTLFEDGGEGTNQKGLPAGAGGLVPPFHGQIS